jgi:hypothetical protein
MNDEARIKHYSPEQAEAAAGLLEALSTPLFTVHKSEQPQPAHKTNARGMLSPSPVLSAGAATIRSKLPEEEREIFDQRYEVYGDPVASHANIGRAWAATLSQYFGIQLKDIPADVVAIMFVQFKALRSTKAYHQDNYDDLRTYATIAEGARKDRHE